jgi:hypothetical protein
MIAMLTVMSYMDPHTIRVTWIGMVGMLGSWSVLSFRSYCHSGLGGMFDVASQVEEHLALVLVVWHGIQPPLSASQNHNQLFLD